MKADAPVHLAHLLAHVDVEAETVSFRKADRTTLEYFIRMGSALPLGVVQRLVIRAARVEFLYCDDLCCLASGSFEHLEIEPGTAVTAVVQRFRTDQRTYLIGDPNPGVYRPIAEELGELLAPLAPDFNIAWHVDSQRWFVHPPLHAELAPLVAAYIQRFGYPTGWVPILFRVLERLGEPGLEWLLSLPGPDPASQVVPSESLSHMRVEFSVGLQKGELLSPSCPGLVFDPSRQFVWCPPREQIGKDARAFWVCYRDSNALDLERLLQLLLAYQHQFGELPEPRKVLEQVLAKRDDLRPLDKLALAQAFDALFGTIRRGDV